MFGLSFSEILIVLVVALLVFGPARLPEIARTLGKTMGELRRAMDEVRFEFNAIDRNAEQAKPAQSPAPETKAITEEGTPENAAPKASSRPEVGPESCE